jgi:hypothetical protein
MLFEGKTLQLKMPMRLLLQQGGMPDGDIQSPADGKLPPPWYF